MPKKHTFNYDLIVIGSGASGSASATIAAREGKRVAIIESDIYGGDSPNWSDIPTKALLHAAELFNEAKKGSRFGLRSSTLGYNYPSIRAWKDLAIKRTGAGGNKKYYDNQGIDTISGKARFISPNEITVGRKHISAKNFVIATGSSWAIPDIQGLENVKYLTPRTILEEIKPPKSLLVIGGSDNGIEIAQLMSCLGTKVTIVDIASRLLPNHDSEVGDLIEKTFSEQRGMTILTHAKVLSAKKDGLSKRVTITRGGVEKVIVVDEIMIAAGRTPNVDIGLENAGVKYTAGGIETNSLMQTSSKHIYAAGNVTGRNSGTQICLLEGQVAVNNILHKSKIVADYSTIPDVIFTSPEIATVGLSEDECEKRDLSYIKSVAPLNIIARSNTADFRDGLVKIIANKKGVIIGATIISPNASEMIHELVIAVKYQMTTHELSITPHAFLSWSEAIRIAAGKISVKNN